MRESRTYKNRRVNLPKKDLASFDLRLSTWSQLSCTSPQLPYQQTRNAMKMLIMIIEI